MLALYISSILLLYLYISLKKDDVPILNFYLGINIIIFYLPALMFILFGLSHPSQGYSLKNNMNYSDYLTNTINLILLFDLTLIIIFKLLNHININLNLLIKPLNIFGRDFSDKFIIVLSIVVLSISLIIDALLFFSNNSLLNKYALECINEYYGINQKFNINNNFKNFIQTFKTISIIKYYLICFIAIINKNFTSKTKSIILILTVIYCLVYGVAIGSRFQMLLPVIILIFIYFKNILKLYNFILFIIFSYLCLYLFPIIGTIRSIFYKRTNQEVCSMNENISESIISNIKYNNVYQESYEALLNINVQNSVLSKPIEIILSRLNYFDVTIKIYHYKIKEKLINNIGYFFDNIYGLIPRFIYPQKKIITNSSELWGVELGLMQHPIHAIGFRPVGEAFLFLGNYYLIIAVLIGFFFSLMYRFLKDQNIILNAIFTYIVILFLKRDSLHAFLPGIVHELIAGLFFILLIILSKKLTSIIRK